MAVAHAGLAEEVSWSGGVALELSAELGQVDAQVAVGVLLACAPDLVEQLPLAHQRARIAQQRLQEMPRGAPLRRRLVGTRLGSVFWLAMGEPLTLE